jgi:hypothetical protein
MWRRLTSQCTTHSDIAFLGRLMKLMLFFTSSPREKPRHENGGNRGGDANRRVNGKVCHAETNVRLVGQFRMGWALECRARAPWIYRSAQENPTNSAAHGTSSSFLPRFGGAFVLAGGSWNSAVFLAAIKLGGFRTAVGVPMLKDENLIGAISRNEFCGRFAGIARINLL